MLLTALSFAFYNSSAMDNPTAAPISGPIKNKGIEYLKKLESVITSDVQKLSLETLVAKRQLLRDKIAAAKNNPAGFMAKAKESKEKK